MLWRTTRYSAPLSGLPFRPATRANSRARCLRRRTLWPSTGSVSPEVCWWVVHLYKVFRFVLGRLLLRGEPFAPHPSPHGGGWRRRHQRRTQLGCRGRLGPLGCSPLSQDARPGAGARSRSPYSARDGRPIRVPRTGAPSAAAAATDLSVRPPWVNTSLRLLGWPMPLGSTRRAATVGSISASAAGWLKSGSSTSA